MRITNNMIVNNTKSNINLNKTSVNDYNTQMSTQKKISRPSEDPVVAIRSLRLATSLSEVTQYYEKNIPDAESWLEVTETALTNMKSILNDVYKQCVNGATDTLTADDRNAILSSLQSLREQVYSEGNAEYAGRTVFTGYKTNTTLAFTEADAAASYVIEENFSFADIEERNYFSNRVTVPTTLTEVSTDIPSADAETMPNSVTNDRIRMSYGSTGDLQSLTYSYTDFAGNEQTGNLQTDYAVTTTTSDVWEEADYVVGDDEIIYVQDTGEFILGRNASDFLKTNNANITAVYNKTGFDAGELRPEHYFNCTKVDTDNPANNVVYTKENQEIAYTISSNQTLAVNTQASDVFGADIGRDVDELAEAVSSAIAAYDKVAKIKEMMTESQYADTTSQEQLKSWLEAAEKEVDYLDDNMQKMFSKGISSFTNYMTDVNLAITDVGSKSIRLSLTKTRMSSQQATLESLKSTNEDREISDIVIDYTAAYTAYNASLQAASKINSSTLLDYL